MKPFDLEAALAGAPVVTWDGRQVKQLTKFNTTYREHVLYGVVDGWVCSWNIDGTTISETGALRMAPTKKTGWVSRHQGGVYTGISDTEEKARETNPSALSYHEIEWEE